MRLINRILPPAALLAVFLVTGLPRADDEAHARVRAAIDSMRGIKYARLSVAEKEALEERLDKAWNVLYQHPLEARAAIRSVQASERRDAFLVLDLTHLLLALDPGALKEAAKIVERMDVNAHPPATFHIASRMAAAGCRECLPAVMRMARLRDLDTRLPAHALTVRLWLGLIFTLGQYGDEAIEPARALLGSGDCVVRGNAAQALAYLQADGALPPIRRLASQDPCVETRAKAWHALGYLDDPTLAEQVRRRLAAKPGAVERRAMVAGLAESFSSSALEVLRRFAKDSDREARELAQQGIRAHTEGLPGVVEKMRQVEGLDERDRARMRKHLKRAIDNHRFSIDGDKAGGGLLGRVGPEDVALLNQARAAVLGRLSDEALSEYLHLTYAVRAVRAAQASDARTASARPPAGGRR